MKPNESAQLQMQLNNEIAICREQLNALRRETERVTLVAVDLTNAVRTVEGFSAQKALIQIGGGAMIKGQITDTKVLLPIGAEYLVEVEKEKAVEELKKRIENTQKAAEQLNQDFLKVMGRLQELSMQVQQNNAQNRMNKQTEENTGEDYV